MVISPSEEQHQRAMAAMQTAAGKPDGRTAMPREDVLRAEGQLDPRLQTKGRTLIAALQDMAARDRDDYSRFIETVRAFVEKKRADLEAFERLAGTK
jgi:hypothetical protein